MSTLTNKDLKPLDAFLVQLDSKIGIEEIISNYPRGIEECGKRLLQGTFQWYYATSPDNEYPEFLDFIDGNGFYVEPLLLGNHVFMYRISPLVKKETI